MKLPYIYMTMKNAIFVRFPKPTRQDVDIVVGEDIGRIPVEAYEPGSAAQIALKWAEQFPAKWSVSKDSNGTYNVTFKFNRFEDALQFKNDFIANVHGS